MITFKNIPNSICFHSPIRCNKNYRVIVFAFGKKQSVSSFSIAIYNQNLLESTRFYLEKEIFEIIPFRMQIPSEIFTKDWRIEPTSEVLNPISSQLPFQVAPLLVLLSPLKKRKKKKRKKRKKGTHRSFYDYFRLRLSKRCDRRISLWLSSGERNALNLIPPVEHRIGSVSCVPASGLLTYSGLRYVTPGNTGS